VGKNQAAKRAAHSLKSLMTNYKFRITSLRHAIRSFSFLCVLCAFAANSLSQDNVFNQDSIDFLPLKISLQEAIQSGSVEQKREALFQIRNFKSIETSRIAIPALNDKSEIVRATATFSVIFLPKDEALSRLLPLLTDKKELVRREAAYALGKVGNASAVNPLLKILQKDKVLEVRAASTVALGEIGDASVVSELVKILQRKPSIKEEFLRRSAARSIGQIAQIIQTNITKVLTPENFLPDKFNSIEKPKYPRLVESFPIFRDATNVLIQTLQKMKESDDVRREAAYALGEIGNALAIPVLQTNLNAKDYYLAKICAEALEKIDLRQTLLKI
jgi:HEAT repeat protein